MKTKRMNSCRHKNDRNGRTKKVVIEYKYQERCSRFEEKRENRKKTSKKLAFENRKY
jgi:hypothetical protein